MGPLRAIWRAWLALADVIGAFVNRLVLTVFYFTVCAPFGLGARLFTDRLNLRGRGGSSWSGFQNRSATVDEARRQ